MYGVELGAGLNSEGYDDAPRLAEQVKIAFEEMRTSRPTPFTAGEQRD